MKMTFDLDDEPVTVAGPTLQPTEPPISANPLFEEFTPAPAPDLEVTPAVLEASPEELEVPQPELEVTPEILEVSSAPTGSEAPPVAPLPSKLMDRPVTPTLASRYAGHAPVNEQVRQDWMAIIEQDPFSYEALLYRPTVAVPTAPDEDGIETPLFTEINNNQVELDYHDPVVVTVLDCPDQRESFQAVDADGDQDGLVDDFLIIRAATTGVSVGSIFEWNEEQMDGSTARRWWYVLRIYTLGTASVGSLYYCIPARNIEGSAEVVINAE